MPRSSQTQGRKELITEGGGQGGVLGSWGDNVGFCAARGEQSSTSCGERICGILHSQKLLLGNK